RRIVAGTFALVVLGVIGAACSSGGGVHTASSKAQVCALIGDLDHSAQAFAATDVSDPEQFHTALSGAVDRYTATVRKFRALVPKASQPNLDRLEAAVDQYRFDEAVTARRALETDSATRCPSTVPTNASTTTTTGAVTTTSAATVAAP